jgi:outer membrane protein
MARFALPRPLFAAATPMFGVLPTLAPLVLAAGCSASHQQKPLTPPEVTPAGVSARVNIPGDLNVNPAETVTGAAAAGRAGPPPMPDNAAAGRTAQPPSQTVVPPPAIFSLPDAFPFGVPPGPALQPPSQAVVPPPAVFSLPDAIAFGLQSNPRLRSSRAAISRAQGQEQIAFSPFLPQIDILGQYGAVSSTYAPGVPGNEGFILASGDGTRSYAETELALQWTLFDFGRTSGRYGQAVARERITELQFTRAAQTIEFDVSSAYLDLLLARASRRVQEDAVRRAQAILDDTSARRIGGVALKEDVLRADVQRSETQEALIVARQGEFNAVARLNNAMGRNASWPLEILDMNLEPSMPASLAQLLEMAAAERPEVALVRQAAEAAQQGSIAARGEFQPRIFVRAAAGRTDGENVVTGWQEGAGLHLEMPLYAGGRHQGEAQAADADVDTALANAQTILDDISLEVNIAYRGAIASRERINLARTAVVQAEENMRLLGVRYRNGNATPTDIVDSEAALTRSQQRFFSATYTYLAALSRLVYALGLRQEAWLPKPNAAPPQKPAEEVPPPRKLPGAP